MSRRSRLRNLNKIKFRQLRPLLLLLLLLSAWQYYDQGSISWHRTVLAELERYPQQVMREWNRTGRKPIPPPPGQQLSGTAVEVTDGDTFILLTEDWSEYDVRLHGIDAPEYDQAHGNLASRALTRLIEHEQVNVVIEDIDRYGRLVGQVTMAGDDINLRMVQAGHAWWYRQYAKSSTHLAEAEQAARNSDAGLWADDTAIAPWIWRRKN